MSVIIFVGPSLPLAEARAILPADYRPPVSQGDVHRAVLQGARVIGLIDGYFERVPAVWHKEILWAMSRGVHVFGASSMGALRAAELFPFGMVGVGAVFEAFRDGRLDDDDEVTIVHGPAELGYPATSEAMVNIRATLERAAEQGVLAPRARDALLRRAKELYYPERSYPALLESVAADDLPQAERAAFQDWLPAGRVDQKRLDAQAMLRAIADLLRKPFEPRRVTYRFEPTDAWEQVSRRLGHQVAAAMPAALPPEILLEEVRLEGNGYRETMALALSRALALREAERGGTPPVDRAVFREALHAFFLRRGLRSPEDIAGWLKEQGLDPDGLTRLIGQETRIAQVETLFQGEMLAQLPDALRVAGSFGRLFERAESKHRWLVDNDLQAAGLEATGLGEEALLRWHFVERRGDTVPEDLDAYCLALGLSDRFTLLQALARDYLFRRQNVE
ncbi:hypothetical protein J2847_004544 [Azospirillum agricola]|uniref:TfuA-like protein n=1 Tax=Azospirillum agricola TaxID=1720247 RepID=UPI001AE77F84|nr:TfuA-like protein [Azospirillum agricola]MBP2231232.1 hypothetical protein [Azospirillum agricola]